MLWYWVAYFIVTGIGIAHTVFNILVLHMKSMKDSTGMGKVMKKQSLGILIVLRYLPLHRQKGVRKNEALFAR